MSEWDDLYGQLYGDAPPAAQMAPRRPPPITGYYDPGLATGPDLAARLRAAPHARPFNFGRELGNLGQGAATVGEWALNAPRRFQEAAPGMAMSLFDQAPDIAWSIAQPTDFYHQAVTGWRDNWRSGNYPAALGYLTAQPFAMAADIASPLMPAGRFTRPIGEAVARAYGPALRRVAGPAAAAETAAMIGSGRDE